MIFKGNQLIYLSGDVTMLHVTMSLLRGNLGLSGCAALTLQTANSPQIVPPDPGVSRDKGAESADCAAHDELSTAIMQSSG